METEERQVRVLWGQYLTRTGNQREVCCGLNGIQAQFLSSALHNLSLRAGGPVEPEALVKNWTVRGTVHLFCPEDLPLYLHEGRDRFLRPVDRMVEDSFVTLDRKKYFAGLILDELAAGEKSREALRAACRAAGMTGAEEQSLFDSWGGLLRCLCEEGKIVHGVSANKTFRLCPPFVPMAVEEARTEMLRRYFAAGPASARDAAYFFGAPQREVRRRMDRLPLEHDAVDGQDVFWLDGGERNWPDAPECVLLSHFDPLLLEYAKTESPFLAQEHLRKIFNLGGIVMPAVLLRGRVAGSWRRKGGTVTLLPFRAWNKGEKKAAQAAAEGLDGVGKVVWAE